MQDALKKINYKDQDTFLYYFPFIQKYSLNFYFTDNL